MPLNESKLFEYSENGTRDEALQRPDRKPISKNTSTPPHDPTPPINASEANGQALGALVNTKAAALQNTAAMGVQLADEMSSQLLNSFALRYAANMKQIETLFQQLGQAQHLAIASDPSLALKPNDAFFAPAAWLPSGTVPSSQAER